MQWLKLFTKASSGLIPLGNFMSFDGTVESKSCSLLNEKLVSASFLYWSDSPSDCTFLHGHWEKWIKHPQITTLRNWISRDWTRAISKISLTYKESFPECLIVKMSNPKMSNPKMSNEVLMRCECQFNNAHCSYIYRLYYWVFWVYNSRQ